MRHAIVVAPMRFVIPAQGNVLTSPEPVGPLCQALSRGGSRVVVLATTPDLETAFDRALGGMGEGDHLLVYVACETTTRTESVAVRLGDDPSATLPLRVLSDIVQVREPTSALFVVEACHDGADDDPMLAAEHVQAIAQALDARARGYGALVGVRPAARATPGAWPFTRHLLYAMQNPESRDAAGGATVARVVVQLRAEQPERAQVQSFVFIPGRDDFLLAARARGPSAPPPVGRSLRPRPRCGRARPVLHPRRCRPSPRSWTSQAAPWSAAPGKKRSPASRRRSWSRPTVISNPARRSTCAWAT
jgi:hypothetical protein